MRGRVACVAGGGVCGVGGHAWQGGGINVGCGGMHGRGVCMSEGACMAVGGRACVAGETATAAGGTHPTGMHSCTLNVNIARIP